MNQPTPRVKRAYRKRTVSAEAAIATPPVSLPRLPPLNPLEAAQEAARNAQEGSLKLSRSVDVLRSTLETIVTAEMDLKTGLPATAKDLRGLAVDGLNAYSQISGQSWRRHKLIGSWAGDRNLDTLED